MADQGWKRKGGWRKVQRVRILMALTNLKQNLFQKWYVQCEISVQFIVKRVLVLQWYTETSRQTELALTGWHGICLLKMLFYFLLEVENPELPKVEIEIPSQLKLKLEDDCYFIKRKKKASITLYNLICD